MSLVPRALQPYGLGQRLTVLDCLRGVVAVRLDQMPHRLRLIRKPLATTGETHQPASGGTLPLGGHRGRGHTASSAWRDGAATRNRCMGSSLRRREVLMAVSTCGRGTQWICSHDAGHMWEAISPRPVLTCIMRLQKEL